MNYHNCICYCRTEVMKQWRRKVGDRGGVRFQGKSAQLRVDHCTNTITSIQKDNLIMSSYGETQSRSLNYKHSTQTTMEQYSELELKPESKVTPLGDCTFDIDGRTIQFAIRKLTPRECFRLMDVDEERIDAIQNAGISNSQQYKLAGNSIVTNCLYEIFRKLYIDTSVAHHSQLSLF